MHGCLTGEPATEKFFNRQPTDKIWSFAKNITVHVDPPHPGSNHANVRKIADSIDTHFDKVMINPVVVVQEQEIFPSGLFDAEIEVVGRPDIDLMSEISQSSVIYTGDKSRGCIGRTIVSYDHLQIFIGLIQRAVQPLSQITVRPVMRRNRNRN